MRELKIPHNAVVFVGDGRKALFLRNEGDEKHPNLTIENVFEEVNPSTHKQGSARPGRVSKAFDSSQRSAVEPVDSRENPVESRAIGHPQRLRPHRRGLAAPANGDLGALGFGAYPATTAYRV